MKRPIFLTIIIVLFAINGIYGIFNTLHTFFKPIPIYLLTKDYIHHSFLQLGWGLISNSIWIVLAWGITQWRNWARLASAVFMLLGVVGTIVLGILLRRELVEIFKVSNQQLNGSGFLICFLFVGFLLLLSWISFYLFKRVDKSKFKTRSEVKAIKLEARRLKQEKLALKKEVIIKKQEEAKNFTPDEL